MVCSLWTDKVQEIEPEHWSGGQPVRLRCSSVFHAESAIDVTGAGSEACGPRFSKADAMAGPWP